ncbi:3-guanidinopropionate transporter [Halarchaeum nitratireducens]|uniref:3-guanidinopropionate transporter n=2 Tax=Halarchaeum nitratireducens TaxID=489913 RepID=A0A830G904_9EURY|nr:3-guanidinopropionate transporter [Halarchaeum nitratireducens]
MIALAYYVYRRQGVTNASEFITAGGRARLGLTTASFAVTWMWAGDVLGVPQYVGITGIAGIWMYAAPAVLSSLVVIPFALRMRRLFPQGLTYSEYFLERFDSRLPHLAVVCVVLYTMVLGGIIQLFVGGAVIGGLTGISPTVVNAVLVAIIGAYILLGGLWSSMTTDFVQFVSAIVLTLVFVPFLVWQAGDPNVVYQHAVTNLGGQADAFFSMGNLSSLEGLFLPYALGLGVWGVVSMATWQRVFAVRRDKTSRFLTVGGIGVFTTIAMYGVIGVVGLSAFPEVSPGNLSVETLSLLPSWAAVVFILVTLMVLGSSVDSYLAAIASLASRDIYYRHWNRDADSSEQLSVARYASIVFAVVVFAGTEFVSGRLSFVTLLLIGGIGASGLVGPFALSLFWRCTSAGPFVAGVVVSQLVTAYLLLGNAALPGWVGLKLWEIMAVGHIVSTGLTALGSAVTPDDFAFADLPDEATRADGGEER